MDVMIVETEPSVVSDLKDVLEELSHAVVGVSSTGEEAIQMAGDLHPDLIIINIQLKGESGVELAEEIKSLHDIPIIFLTVFIKNCLNKSLQVPEDALVIGLPIHQEHLQYAIELALSSDK